MSDATATDKAPAAQAAPAPLATPASQPAAPAPPATAWDKIKAGFKHSVTILVARLTAAAGALVLAVQNLSNDPSIQNAVHSVLKPEYMPYYVIGIGLVVELARRRTAGK